MVFIGENIQLYEEVLQSHHQTIPTIGSDPFLWSDLNLQSPISNSSTTNTTITTANANDIIQDLYVGPGGYEIEGRASFDIIEIVKEEQEERAEALAQAEGKKKDVSGGKKEKDHLVWTDDRTPSPISAVPPQQLLQEEDNDDEEDGGDTVIRKRNQKKSRCKRPRDSTPDILSHTKRTELMEVQQKKRKLFNNHRTSNNYLSNKQQEQQQHIANSDETANSISSNSVCDNHFSRCSSTGSPNTFHSDDDVRYNFENNLNFTNCGKNSSNCSSSSNDPTNNIISHNSNNIRLNISNSNSSRGGTSDISSDLPNVSIIHTLTKEQLNSSTKEELLDMELAMCVKEMLSHPITFGSMMVKKGSKTPYTDATQTKKQKEDYVKRPMNAFMVFSQSLRKVVVIRNPDAHNAQISIRLGKHWKEMTLEQQAIFKREADILRDLHKIEYPDYKYKPQKKQPRAKAATVAGTPKTVNQEGNNCQSPVPPNGVKKTRPPAVGVVSVGRKKRSSASMSQKSATPATGRKPRKNSTKSLSTVQSTDYEDNDFDYKYQPQLQQQQQQEQTHNSSMDMNSCYLHLNGFHLNTMLSENNLQGPTQPPQPSLSSSLSTQHMLDHMKIEDEGDVLNHLDPNNLFNTNHMITLNTGGGSSTYTANDLNNSIIDSHQSEFISNDDNLHRVGQEISVIKSSNHNHHDPQESPFAHLEYYISEDGDEALNAAQGLQSHDGNHSLNNLFICDDLLRVAPEQHNQMCGETHQLHHHHQHQHQHQQHIQHTGDNNDRLTKTTHQIYDEAPELSNTVTMSFKIEDGNVQYVKKEHSTFHTNALTSTNAAATISISFPATPEDSDSRILTPLLLSPQSGYSGQATFTIGNNNNNNNNSNNNTSFANMDVGPYGVGGNSDNSNNNNSDTVVGVLTPEPPQNDLSYPTYDNNNRSQFDFTQNEMLKNLEFNLFSQL